MAKYDLLLTSQNTVLDADNDAEETAAADADDEVTFVLNQLDKNGNEDAAYSANVGTIALTDDAVVKLVNSGALKVVAKVGNVTVDTLDVSYKNTDAVASKAVVNSSNRVVDLSTLATGGTSVSVQELLFGKLNSAGTKYVLNPAVTVQDQSGTTMSYDIAEGLDVLKNGLSVVPATPVLTNLNNVTNTSGTLTLTDDTKSGSVTIVVPAVDTETSGGATVNSDLLAAPVSFTVTLVK